MKRILSALTLSAVLASPAWSEYTILGNGVLTCGEFSEKHDQYGKQLGIEQWIWGVFSGLNASSGIYSKHEAHAGKYHQKALYAAVLKYCRDNPLQNIAYGTLVTYMEVKEKR